MNFDALTHALEARRSGSAWMARCPAHEDSNPSLSIREVDGKILLHCHGGCRQGAVIDALKARGLWDAAPEKIWAKRIVATYPYVDERGELLYEICRYEPKGFSQRYPNGRGGWTWKKHPRQVLYHLPEVLESPIVFLPEGEKDCETLRAWGFCATCEAGGAKVAWLPTFSESLRGREVILLPDNDQAGRARVLRIARALLGTAARIVILELEGAKDVSDWFAAGHGEAELIAQIEGEAVTQ